ncbi:MAG: hypothetical protein AAFV30_05945, partial [Pseudomonadota bacterium]
MGIDAVRTGSENVQQLEAMLADAQAKQAAGDTSQSRVIQVLVQRIRAARAAQAERTHQLAESAEAHRSAGAREEVMTERAAGQKAARQTAGFDVERVRHGEMPKAHRDEVARGGVAFPGPPPEAEVPGPRQAMQFLPTLLGMTEAEFDAFRASGDFDRLLSSLVHRPAGTHDGPDTAQLRQRAPLLLDDVPERSFPPGAQTPRSSSRQGGAQQGRSPLAMPQQTRTSGLATGPGGLPPSPSPSRAPGGLPGATPVSYSPSTSTPGLATASRAGNASLVYRAGARADPTLGQLIGGTNGGGGISLHPDLLNVGITSNFDQWGAAYFMAFFMRHGMVMGDIESLLRELRNAYDELEQLNQETAISGRARAHRRARAKAAAAAVKEAMGLYRAYLTGEVSELVGANPVAAQQNLDQMRAENQRLLREARMWPPPGGPQGFESAPGPAVLTEADLEGIEAIVGSDRIQRYRADYNRLQRQWSQNAGGLAAASLYEGEMSDRLTQLAIASQPNSESQRVDRNNLLDFVFSAQANADPAIQSALRAIHEQRPLTDSELEALAALDPGNPAFGRSMRELENSRREAYGEVQRRIGNTAGNEYAIAVMRQIRDGHRDTLSRQLEELQQQHREQSGQDGPMQLDEYQQAADMHRQLALFDRVMMEHRPQNPRVGDTSGEADALSALNAQTTEYADPAGRQTEWNRFQINVLNEVEGQGEAAYRDIEPVDRHIARMIVQLRDGGIVRDRLMSQLLSESELNGPNRDGLFEERLYV